jgi:tRNA G18 (ribose-2'-O)-methylase SpoU
MASDQRRPKSDGTRTEVAPTTRRRVAGVAEVAHALDAGLPIQCVLLPRKHASPEALQLAARAAAQGIDVQRPGPRKFQRLQGQHTDAAILALVGPTPDADLAATLARGGAVWLLTGPAYPGNVGFAIRIAEVSGADGLYIDNDFDHARRREARRTSMRADRFMPVGWERADVVIEAARRAGKRVIGIEDVGTRAPWEVDLTGAVLLIAGGEAEGIPPDVLARCDAVVRIPMAGFVASYNLQAALAAVASERFRQLERERS